MDEETKRVTGLFSRYFIILLLGLGNLYLFYKVLTPVTISVLTVILSMFREIVVRGTFIIMGPITVAIVPACVAGAAFYLLFILVFSTAQVSVKKRLLLLLGTSMALFVLNVLRIVFLILIIGQPFFNTVHWLLWNVVSTLFVVLIWVIAVRLYNIKTIPVYSDLQYIFGLVQNSRKKSK